MVNFRLYTDIGELSSSLSHYNQLRLMAYLFESIYSDIIYSQVSQLFGNKSRIKVII